VSYQNLKLFRDIAQTRSFSRGAAMNGVSQSAASQQLRDLENELGVSLFDRSSRPLVVTPAGHLYSEFCREVLRRREEFELALDRLKRDVEGTVRVAAIYSIGLSEMAQVEQEFARRLPDAHIHVEYLRPEKVYEAVLADTVDLGLLSYPGSNRDITVIPWRQEEMVVAVSPDHPLARMGQVAPRDLNGLEFVGFDEELPIRREVDRFLRDQGVEVIYTARFDNLHMIKEAVAHRMGVSIMPARIMNAEIEQGRLVAIPIAGVDLRRPIGIIHRRKKRFLRVAQAFLDLLLETATSDGEAGGDASAVLSPASHS
jgi:DNA-binding transcriptional LysR family regulator